MSCSCGRHGHLVFMMGSGGLPFRKLKHTDCKAQPLSLRDSVRRYYLSTNGFSPLCMKGKIWNHWMLTSQWMTKFNAHYPHEETVLTKNRSLVHTARISKPCGGKSDQDRMGWGVLRGSVCLAQTRPHTPPPESRRQSMTKTGGCSQTHCTHSSEGKRASGCLQAEVVALHRHTLG